MKAALRFLVRLFPAAFRERFGAGMIEDLERDYDRARARGKLAAVWCALATSWDLLRSAVAEHVNPAWVRTQRSAISPVTEDNGMWTARESLLDLRHAIRSLRRSPAFTVVAVGTLGLAIGANAAMFSVVNTVLLDPLPYANADRLVHIAASAPGSDMSPEFGVSAEFYVQYKEQSKLLEDVSTYNSFTSTLRAGDRVERIRMSWPTNSLYSTLGAKPILGRLPDAEDEDRVVVISYALWTSWFGRDSAVVGKSYIVGEDSRTVVGVMGPEFKFPNDGALLWMSSEIRPEGITPGRFGPALVGRMKPGVTPEAVARELTALSKRLPERFGGSANYARLIAQHRAVVRSLEDEMLGSVSGSLWVLLGAVGIVLLIACANVANLFMVRAEGRQRDLAVRRAIGAARGQLIRSQMAEAVVVAAFAGVVAMALAWAGLPVLLRLAPQDIPRLERSPLGRHDAAVHVRRRDPVRARVRPRAGDPRVGARPHAAARRRPRRDAQPRMGARWAGRRADGAGARAADRLGAARAQLPGAAPGRSRLRHGEHLHVSDRAGGSEPARRPVVRPFRSRVHGADFARCPVSSPLGWSRTFRSTRERPSRASARKKWGARPTRARCSTSRSRPATTSRRWGSTCSRAVRSKRTIASTIETSSSASRRRISLWPGKDPIGRRLQRHGLTSWETVVGVVDDVMQEGLPRSAAAAHLLPARRADAEELDDLVAGVRREDASRGDDRAGGPRARPRGRAERADVPRVHDGGAGAGLDDAAVVHDADARHRVGARADPRRRRALRRAVVRRRAADARDRRAHGARRARRGGAADGGGAGRARGGRRRASSASPWRWRSRGR